MIKESGVRRLPCWITSFVEYTDGLPTPLIFRQWAAINALAGLLERRVWVSTAQGEVYPNLYNLFVGKPGVGKSEAIRVISRLWKEMRDLEGGAKLHVSPDNMTKASLVRTLSKAQTRRVLRDANGVDDLVEYHSLLVASSEFSVFFPSYDTAFMSVLTDLYDCRDDYTEDRISTGETKIYRPQLHFVGGTTPGFMASTFPDTAWTMGFSSRLIIIYSAEEVRPTLFGTRKNSDALWASLVHDAKIIATQYGELKWDPEAQALLESWNANGRAPAPTHPKLATYSTRRILHVLKLVAVACMARPTHHIVTADDVTLAIAWMVEAEQHMPGVFAEMGHGGGSSVLLDLHHWALDLKEKTGRPIPEARIVNFLAQRVQSYQVVPTLALAIKNGMFQVHDGAWTPIGGQ